MNTYTVEEYQLFSEMLSESSTDMRSFNRVEFTQRVLRYIDGCFFDHDRIHGNFNSLADDLYRVHLSQEEIKDFKGRELFGEGIFFVIFQEQTGLTFNIFRRHLYRLFFTSDITDMLPLIHMNMVGEFAKWRIQIGH